MEKVIERIKNNEQLRTSLIELKSNSEGHEVYFEDKKLYSSLVDYLT